MRTNFSQLIDICFSRDESYDPTELERGLREDLAEFGATVLRILTSRPTDELAAPELNRIFDAIPNEFRNNDGTLLGLWSTEPAGGK